MRKILWISLLALIILAATAVAVAGQPPPQVTRQIFSVPNEPEDIADGLRAMADFIEAAPPCVIYGIDLDYDTLNGNTRVLALYYRPIDTCVSAGIAPQGGNDGR